MTSTIVFTGRNLRLFIRDRTAVFFALLSSLVLIALFSLFLGDLEIKHLERELPMADAEDIHWFVDAWVLAAIVMITTVTSSLAVLAVFVDDKASGRFSDFIVSPLRRVNVILGYLLSSFIISMLMSLLLLAVSQLYLLMQGEGLMSTEQTFETIGYVALSCATFAAIGSFIVTFMNSTGGFAAISTIVGTLVGFLAGAYIPIGQLPDAVGTGMNVLPFAQTAMLIRGPMTSKSFEAMVDGIPASAQDTLSEYYGITAYVGDTQITTTIAIAVLVVLFVVFTALGVWRLSRSIR